MTRDIIKRKKMYVEIYDKDLPLGRKLEVMWEELPRPVWAAEAPQENLYGNNSPMATIVPPLNFLLPLQRGLPASCLALCVRFAVAAHTKL